MNNFNLFNGTTQNVALALSTSGTLGLAEERCLKRPLLARASFARTSKQIREKLKNII